MKLKAMNSENRKKVTTQSLQKMKEQGEKITMLTAYDYTFANLLDKAGIDMILIGDSASGVMSGYKSTLPITLDEMIYHASCVSRGTEYAFVVADLPFGAYQQSDQQAMQSAIRMMKESGVEAVKIEGGALIAPAIQRMTGVGIPVIGHLGLTPQSVNLFGGYGLRGSGEEEADKIRKDALLLEESGCCAVVLEKIPHVLAGEITRSLHIPTIGIGAGNQCDGQVLVMHDMLGLNSGFHPKFVRRYLDLSNEVINAVGNYVKDVKSNAFPSDQESY